jgi:hypothetical protein
VLTVARGLANAWVQPLPAAPRWSPTVGSACSTCDTASGRLVALSDAVAAGINAVLNNPPERAAVARADQAFGRRAAHFGGALPGVGG